MRKSWNEALALHAHAADEYAAAAEAVTSWEQVPAPGKWSPAQITAHLVLSFEAILCELTGGPPMALRTRAWQRVVLRFTIMRRLLNGGPFPHGAPAPRETRPPEKMSDRQSSIAEFRRLAGELDVAFEKAHRDNRSLRFRHPYFGYVHAADGIYISARHIDHHRTQIAGR